MDELLPLDAYLSRLAFLSRPVNIELRTVSRRVLFIECSEAL